MKEAQESISSEQFVYPETKAFFTDLVADPNHPLARFAQENIPNEKAALRRARNLNITATYFFTPATLEDLGQVYGGISRERVSKVIKHTVRQLYSYASTSFHRNHRLSEVPLGKPLSIKTLRRRSVARGGRSVKIEQLLKGDATISDLKEKLQIDSQDIGASREVLSGWRVAVPYEIRTMDQNKQLELALQQPQDRKTLQDLLNSVTIYFYRLHVQADDSLLVSVKTVAKAYRFSSDQSWQFVRALEHAGVPYGHIKRLFVKDPLDVVTLTYRFIARQSTSDALDAFARDTSLDKFLESKIKQIAGPKAESLPTIWQFQHKKGFHSIKVLRGLFGDDKPNRIELSAILARSPVTIYQYDTGKYYSIADEKQLMKFVKSKRKK